MVHRKTVLILSRADPAVDRSVTVLAACGQRGAETRMHADAASRCSGGEMVHPVRSTPTERALARCHRTPPRGAPARVKVLPVREDPGPRTHSMVCGYGIWIDAVTEVPPFVGNPALSNERV